MPDESTGADRLERRLSSRLNPLTTFPVVRRQVVIVSLSGAAIPLALTAMLAIAPAGVRDGAQASFGIFTALATGAAAIAAWRSASSSSAAARDVREALGLGIKPSIEVTPLHGGRHSPGDDADGVLGVRIKNNSTWPAVDIVVTAHIHDGRTYREQLGRLGATNINALTATEAFVELARNVSPPNPQIGSMPEGKHALENEYLIRYWDERHLLQWEHSLRMHYIYEVSDREAPSAATG